MITRIIFLVFLSIPVRADLDHLLEPVIVPKSSAWFPHSLELDPKIKIETDSYEEHTLLEDEINQLLTKALTEKFSPIGNFSANIIQDWKSVIVRKKHWKFEMVQYPAGGLRSHFNARFRILNEGMVLGI